MSTVDLEATAELPEIPRGTPVNRYLDSDDRWKKASGEMKATFRVAMRGRQYGYEPTCDAWAWFCVGWSARLSQP